MMVPTPILTNQTCWPGDKYIYIYIDFKKDHHMKSVRTPYLVLFTRLLGHVFQLYPWY